MCLSSERMRHYYVTLRDKLNRSSISDINESFFLFFSFLLLFVIIIIIFFFSPLFARKTNGKKKKLVSLSFLSLSSRLCNNYAVYRVRVPHSGGGYDRKPSGNRGRERESNHKTVHEHESSGRRKKADFVLDLDPRMVVKVCPMWAE